MQISKRGEFHLPGSVGAQAMSDDVKISRIHVELVAKTLNEQTDLSPNNARVGSGLETDRERLENPIHVQFVH